MAHPAPCTAQFTPLRSRGDGRGFPFVMVTMSLARGALGIAATLLLAFFFVGRINVGAAVLNASLYERRLRSRDSGRRNRRRAS